MSPILYHFTPVLLGAIFVLSIKFKIYKRSVSTFITLFALALSATLMHFGMFDQAIIVILITAVVLLYRAMTKDQTDVLVHHIHRHCHE